ncbi:DUF493 family protein [Maridesulfovibrio bastinii]|uniref:DUF493 family protein n=1 Tax=Maridesulfovibrio bastinii TaxID=47157 RepID=UPI00041BF90C|nr:DUF493 family protein [Maridesulfovibrio bastinii]
MGNSLESFKQTLDENHDWPCEYTFKFIIPATSIDEIKSMLDGIEFSIRESKGGKYISITACINACGSDEIINIYSKASTIEGIISL